MTGNLRPQGGKDRPEITERQLEALRAIVAFQAEHGYAITVRELSAAIGNTSTNSTQGHLRALQRKGLVTWVPARTRTLSLTAAGHLALAGSEPAATTAEAAR